MRVSDCVSCLTFSCPDVKHDRYIVPGLSIHPDSISVILISESAPADPNDYYYAKGNPLFQQTTVKAFRAAGADVSSVRDILALGVYLTTAVKCAKRGYDLDADTIRNCSYLLEKELSLFHHKKVLLLMGDVAIKALNAIAQRNGAGRVIPALPTYKLRGQEFYFHGVRVIPSYLQAGPSFFIEKGKQKVIAEDIATALSLAHPEDVPGVENLSNAESKQVTS